MNWHGLLPLGIVLSSLLPGTVIFALREDQQRLRVTLNLLGVTLKLLLVGGMLYGVSQGSEYRFSVPLLPGAPLVLQADALSLLFVALSSLLWAATTIYAIGYGKLAAALALLRLFQPVRQRHRGPGAGGQHSQLSAVLRAADPGHLPLVVHRGTPESLTAGRVYGLYGGRRRVVLMGVGLLHSLAGTPDFRAAGYLLEQVDEHEVSLQVAFVLLILGLGVKAALIPLHGWLPQAWSRRRRSARCCMRWRW